ncbi:hypothetical protein N7490_000754, partial [Penicillium lividum]
LNSSRLPVNEVKLFLTVLPTTYAYRPVLFVRRMVHRRFVQSTAEEFLVRRRLADVDTTHLAATRRHERIYISSIHWNNEKILYRHWINIILQLA